MLNELDRLSIAKGVGNVTAVTLRLEEDTRVMSRTLWHTTPQCVVRVEKPCAQSKETSYCEIVFEHSFYGLLCFTAVIRAHKRKL